MVVLINSPNVRTGDATSVLKQTEHERNKRHYLYRKKFLAWNAKCERFNRRFYRMEETCNMMQ
jgi:hypothetical protein